LRRAGACRRRVSRARDHSLARPGDYRVNYRNDTYARLVEAAFDRVGLECEAAARGAATLVTTGTAIAAGATGAGAGFMVAAGARGGVATLVTTGAAIAAGATDAGAGFMAAGAGADVLVAGDLVLLNISHASLG
jgi:hypothetical protein